MSVKTVSGPFLRCVPALLGLVLLCGCDEGYSEAHKYAVRSDPLVTSFTVSELNQEPPLGFDGPGQLPVLLLDIAARRNKSLNDLRVLDPTRLGSEQRRELEQGLTDLFGTPAQPRVSPSDPAGLQSLQPLKLDEQTLAEGSALYRQHCLHCHGLSGDGRGPTAPWVNPHPRDYRQGVFKFTASSQGDKERKPRREDLLRTLRMGIEGTSMPSFGLLPEEQLEQLVSYVIHLSLRGETEYQLLSELLSGSSQGTIPEGLQFWVGRLRDLWLAAPGSLIQPEQYPYTDKPDELKASALRGQNLFLQTTDAGCVKCHKDYGRQSPYTYDVWGTIVQAADLTTGVYRGGRRPVDLYWRIHSGITGTGMPAFSNAISSKDIWDLVNFLQVLPYPQMRKEYGIDIH
jgi:mono/diheme cytochrome c family protein